MPLDERLERIESRLDLLSNRIWYLFGAMAVVGALVTLGDLALRYVHP